MTLSQNDDSLRKQNLLALVSGDTILSVLSSICHVTYSTFVLYRCSLDLRGFQRHQEEEPMAKADRRAEVTWQGNLVQGSGRIDSVGSGAFGNLPITWASRTESSDGKTSPEELI